MAKKTDLIVSGAGMFLSLITLLVEGVKRLGGTIEDIHFLITEEGRPALEEVARVIVAARKKVVEAVSMILKINRTTPFDPTTFPGLGQGWKIVEEDERSLAMTEVNLVNVQLVTTLKDGETVVNGEEKLKRLKQAGHIRLDAKVFQTLWENQALIPERWKAKTNGNTTYIYFDGTVLQGPRGRRFVLYLCWDDGRWRWRCTWLGFDWLAFNPSAVLAK